MPIPKPRADESEEGFLGRCMANATMMADYPNRDQRLAVCAAQLPTKKITKQTSAAQDLRQKLEMERILLNSIDAYHRDVYRDFVRQAVTTGTPPDMRPKDAVLAALLLSHYKNVMALFMGQLNNRLPMDKRLSDAERRKMTDALNQYFEQRAPVQAATINQTTSDDQVAALQQARTDGPDLSTQEIGLIAAATVSRSLYGRRMSIAITETQAPAEATKATEAETLAGLPPSVTGGSHRQTDAKKTWDSVGDSHTRAAHLEADGQRVPLNQPFNVGGQELRYPGDGSLGASAWNLVNCRCGVTYDEQAIAAQR